MFSKFRNRCYMLALLNIYLWVVGMGWQYLSLREVRVVLAVCFPYTSFCGVEGVMRGNWQYVFCCRLAQLYWNGGLHEVLTSLMVPIICEWTLAEYQWCYLGCLEWVVLMILLEFHLVLMKAATLLAAAGAMGDDESIPAFDRNKDDWNCDTCLW